MILLHQKREDISPILLRIERTCVFDECNCIHISEDNICIAPGHSIFYTMNLQDDYTGLCVFASQTLLIKTFAPFRLLSWLSVQISVLSKHGSNCCQFLCR